MPTIQERTISGKGVLQVPDNQDVKDARIFTLYADVFRRPVNPYINKNYNPPKSRYATLNFFRDSYLVKSITMDFPSMSWDFHPELNYQNLYALDCVYEGVLQSIANLGTALNLTVISVDNNIALFRHTALFFDEIKVVCHADTAIKLRLESKAYDFCPEQEDYEPDPPPPPPDEFEEAPPGVPLQDNNGVSLPYDGSTFDNGDTEPFELDTYDFPDLPPPSGETCEEFPIAIDYEILSGDGITWVAITNTVTVYGEYNLEPILVPLEGGNGETAEIQMFCQGTVAPGNVCRPYAAYQIRNFVPNGAFIRNVSLRLR